MAFLSILVQYDRQQPIGLLKIAGMKVNLEDLLNCGVDLVEDGMLRSWAVDSVNKDKRLIYERIDNAAYKQAVDSARKMKAKGYATQDIAEITGLTAEEIEAL